MSLYVVCSAIHQCYVRMAWCNVCSVGESIQEIVSCNVAQLISTCKPKYMTTMQMNIFIEHIIEEVDL